MANPPMSVSRLISGATVQQDHNHSVSGKGKRMINLDTENKKSTRWSSFNIYGREIARERLSIDPKLDLEPRSPA